MPFLTAIPPSEMKSDETGNGERLVGDDQRQHTTDEGGRQGVQDLQDNADGRKQQHQNDEHADDGDTGQHHNGAGGSLLTFKLTAVFNEVAFRQIDLDCRHVA